MAQAASVAGEVRGRAAVVFIVTFAIIFAVLSFLAALFIGPLDESLTHHLY